MQRMLAITVLLALLVAVIPAQAAEGRVSVSDGIEDAQRAASSLNGAVVEPGEVFSFNRAAGTDLGVGGCATATALYLALQKTGAASFDDLSYASDGSGLLVDGGHDFQFTNLAAGALRIAFEVSGNGLTCTVTVDEAEASSEALPDGERKAPGRADTVTIGCGSDGDVLHNVALAADSVYDTTLATGDVFSFNGAVGPTAAEFGYVPAANGRGETVSGGGVDQVASALWLLIQDRPDMVIVQKSTYGSDYCQEYVDNPADAILTDYASGADFTFRYTGEGAVTLYAVLEGDSLTVAIQ